MKNVCKPSKIITQFEYLLFKLIDKLHSGMVPPRLLIKTLKTKWFSSILNHLDQLDFKVSIISGWS